jgi:hypothetical protein
MIRLRYYLAIEEESMKLFKWLLIGLTGLMLFTFLSMKQILSAFLALLAISIFIPWSRNWLVSKLPILANPGLQSALWIILFLGSCGAIESTAELNGLGVCAELRQNQCASAQTPFFAKSPKLYLTGEAKHLREQSELKLTLQKQVAGGSQLVDTLKVKPTITKLTDSAQLSLEFQPKELPAGDYVLNIEATQGRFRPTSQNFSVWDAAMKDIKVCGEIQGSACAKDMPALMRDRRKIYISATPEKMTEGMDVDWSLQYTSEVGKTKVLDNKTIQAELKGDQMILPIAPKSLPVGSYELTLSSPQKRFEAQKKAFTVWHSAENVAARLDDRLLASTAQLGKLNLCDRTGKPIPKDEPIEETVDPKTGKKVQKTRKSYDRNFCSTNSEEFPTTATALGFRIDTVGLKTTTNLEVTWLYGARELSELVELKPDADGLTYTLTSDSGFPPGDYGLILSLATKDSQPIYREFKVK